MGSKVPAVEYQPSKCIVRRQQHFRRLMDCQEEVLIPTMPKSSGMQSEVEFTDH